MKNKLVIIAGPTAVGKTSLSIKLAKELNTEIISADSMQVYKGMDIGTAKIKENEKDGIVHHMIDIVEPSINYDLFTFQKTAKDVIEKLIKQDKIPLVVGGTGFYIQALYKDIDFTDTTDNEYRRKLIDLYNKNGADYLYDMLLKCDKEYAQITHKNNIKRVIRALEFYKTKGYKLSEHNTIEKEKNSKFDLKYFVLIKNRQTLYNDIDLRVDIMMNEGFLDEVKRIKALNVNSNSTSIKALGYSELLDYLDGKYSLEDAIDLIKKNTRHFAKRQITWFKHEKNAIFIDKDIHKTEEDILKKMMEIIND